MSRPFLGLCALSFYITVLPVLAQEGTPAESVSPVTLIQPSVVAPAPPTSIISEDSVVSEPEITLEELLQLALKNNPSPRIAAANLDAARERAGALRSLPNLVLQAVPGVGGNYDSRNEELLISQPLDVFGQRRAQRSALEAQARQAQAEADLTSRALVFEVKNAAAQLFAAQESEALGVSQVAIAKAFRDAAARKAELGDAPAVQAQRAGLELERAQNDLDSARAERLARRANLNQIIGNAPETPLRVALPESAVLDGLTRLNARLDTLPMAIPHAESRSEAVSAQASSAATSPNLPDLPSSTTENSLLGSSSQVGSNLVANRTQLLPQALSSRPDVMGAQAALEARRASVNVVTRSRYPQVEIQVRRDAVVYSATGTSLRAVITVPIFDLGSIKHQKKAAEADVRAQENQLALLKSQVAAQVESALIRLAQQRTTVERYRTSIVPQTLDLLRKTQVGYAAGASTYLEVLEAGRATRQVQTEYLQALVGVRTSEASLESAFGAGLPTPHSGPLSNPMGPPTPDGIAPPGTLPPGVVPSPNVTPLNPLSSVLPPSGVPTPSSSNEGGR